MVLGGLALIGAAGYEVKTFKELQTAGISPVLICQKMNELIIPHYAGHALFSLSLLIFQFKAFLFNLPLLLWRGYLFSKKAHTLNPVALGGDKVHGSSGLSISARLNITFLCYCISALYYLYRWGSC